MDLLKLTDKMMPDQKILININRIITVERDDDVTVIMLFGREARVLVTETPEEIWEMLNKLQRKSLNE